MKKIFLICTTVLVCGSLAACGNSSSTKSASKSSSSSKVIRHHKHKKQIHKKSSSSNSENNVSNSNVKDNNQSQQTGQSNVTQQSANNGQLPPSSDLHDFVNRYGESPAAYLSDHYGMSPEQAVQSVPNNMKSSGEIQDTYMIQQGQDPFANQ